jgi:hypothetical protein
MNIVSLHWPSLRVDPDLTRTGHAKLFLGRLRASIDAMGLAEPLKVAREPGGGYVIVDGVMRYRAMEGLRASDRSRFSLVPTYAVEYERRFEVRFQTDVYQDLLPSQLAALVEHLHQQEGVTKAEIAQAIGVSAATLRNYTGLWRLVQRGGLFSLVVRMMDQGVLPASNPYAWLRLNDVGVRIALENLADGRVAESWAGDQLVNADGSAHRRISIDEVERVTGSLPDRCYRELTSVRQMKKGLGLRRQTATAETRLRREATDHLTEVISVADSPIIIAAATSLRAALA